MTFRVLLAVWVFAFVAFGGTTLAGIDPTVRLVSLAVFAGPVLAWAVVGLRGRRVDLLDAAILVGVAVHLLVAFLSLDVAGSLEASAIVVVYAGTFWLARRVGSDPRLTRTTSLAIVMALAGWLVLIAVTWTAEKVADAMAFGWPPQLDAFQPFAWGSINTPPVLALLAVPFLARLAPGRARRVLADIVAVSAVVVVPFSVGRAAWVGIIVALLTLELISGAPVTRRVWEAAVGWVGRTATIGAGVVLLVVAGVAAVVASGSVASALGSRELLWQQALGLFAADPLSGSGPGTFSWARLVHVPDFADRVGASAAHNVPLHTLAEGGLLLAAALLGVVAAWAWLVISRRGELDGPQRIGVATVVGYAAFALLDDFSFLPAVIALVIVIAAWSLPRPSVAPAHGARGWLLAPAMLVLAAIATGPSVVSLGLMRVGLAEARAAAVSGDWEVALSGFRDATTAQPASALHWMSVGIAAHHLGRGGEAIEAYEEATRRNPGDPRPWGALAALQPEDREELLWEAARRSNDPQYAYRLGVAQLDAGWAEEAAKSFATAAVIEPLLLGVVPDAVADLVPSRLDAAIARVGSISERDPFEVTWNESLLRDAAPAGAPMPWLVARQVDAGDAERAATSLRTATANGPRDVRTWEAAAAVAHLDCDANLHARALRRLDLLRAGTAPSADHEVAVRRAGIYREPDLGDYQPLTEPSLPDVRRWPLPFIEVPDCGW